MKFMDYLKESKEAKNLHLEHLEDNVLNRGVSGARESIDFFVHCVTCLLVTQAQK
jgi:hypothetical protein